jgi:hypothetical protein
MWIGWKPWLMLVKFKTQKTLNGKMSFWLISDQSGDEMLAAFLIQLPYLIRCSSPGWESDILTTLAALPSN